MTNEPENLGVESVTSDHVDEALRLAAIAAAETDAFMQRWLTDRALPAELRSAISYSLLAGGKRLRPTLCLLSAESVGSSEGRRDAMPAAAALELVHAFSLVHDDLPAMDDDSMRRGRPTLHVHAGEAMAILAGDGMIAMAFEVLLQNDAATRVDRASIAQELAFATTNMVGGQVYDTLGGFDASLSDAERVKLTHMNKTGALLRASCRMGAISGGASSEELDRLTRYGNAVGLMYQIVDDLIDLHQTADHAGKATGKDAAAGKLTYPAVLGESASRDAISSLTEEALDALRDLGENSRPLRDVCNYLATRTK